METFTINEGSSIHLIHETKFNTSVICLLIRRPLSRAESTLNSLAVNVLKSGCRKYKNINKINNYLESLYGAVFSGIIVKKGDEQILQFYIDVLNDGFGTALYQKAVEFLYNIVFEPLTDGEGFLEDIFQREKENLKKYISSRINDKTEYLKLKTLEKACEGEAFGIYADGYYEDIDKIDRVSLLNHYRKILQSSAIDIITLTDKKENVQILKKSFNIHRNVILVKNTVDNPIKKEEPLIINAPKNVSQGKICIAVKTGIVPDGEAFSALLVLNEILGGSSNSRLFTVVREEHGLCYNINSFIYRFKGIIMIQCGVEKENIDKTVNLIQSILEDFKINAVSETEIINARYGIVNSLSSIYDYPSSLIDFYATQMLAGDSRNIEEFIASIKKVNKDGVFNAASKMVVDTVYSIT